MGLCSIRKPGVPVLHRDVRVVDLRLCGPHLRLHARAVQHAPLSGIHHSRRPVVYCLYPRQHHVCLRARDRGLCCPCTLSLAYLPQVQPDPEAADAPLRGVRRVCCSHGPPLPVDCVWVRGPRQLQVLCPRLSLRLPGRRLHGLGHLRLRVVRLGLSSPPLDRGRGGRRHRICCCHPHRRILSLPPR